MKATIRMMGRRSIGERSRLRWTHDSAPRGPRAGCICRSGQVLVAPSRGVLVHNKRCSTVCWKRPRGRGLRAKADVPQGTNAPPRALGFATNARPCYTCRDGGQGNSHPYLRQPLRSSAKSFSSLLPLRWSRLRCCSWPCPRETGSEWGGQSLWSEHQVLIKNC